MSDVAAACSLLLAAVFAVASLAKLRDRRAFRAVLARALGQRASGPIAWCAPAVELGLAAWLASGYSTALAGAAALALLGVMSALLPRLARADEDGSCRCFGALGEPAEPSVGLARNAALALAAAAVVLAGPVALTQRSAELLAGQAVVALALGCLWATGTAVWRVRRWPDAGRAS